MRMNSPEGKSVLALVRGAAFAHAGETEAIDLVLAPIAKDTTRRVLDAGCGLGGTADHVRQGGWGRVTGVDIDAVSIGRAKENFPQCDFEAMDIGAVGSRWQGAFGLIYSFNAFYAFPDQPAALRQLAITAEAGARMVLFDYTDPRLAYAASSFSKREEASFWRPINAPELEEWASAAGWRLEDERDLTTEYVRWYADFVARIEGRESEIRSLYGDGIYAFTLSFYGDLHRALLDGTIGGGVFYLTRRD